MAGPWEDYGGSDTATDTAPADEQGPWSEFTPEQPPAPQQFNIKLSPYDQATMDRGGVKPPSGTESGTEMTGAIASDPRGFAKSIPSIVGGAMMAPGKLAYAGAADLVAGATGDTGYGGNLASMQRGEDQLPAEKMIGSAAQSSPKLAVSANIAKSIAEMAPMMGMAVLPASINRIAAGAFSLQMIAGVKSAATELGTELGKPVDEQDAGKIASLKSDLIQTGIFAPLAGAGAVSGLVKPPAKFQGPLATGEVLPPRKGAVPSPETQAVEAVRANAPEAEILPPTGELSAADKARAEAVFKELAAANKQRSAKPAKSASVKPARPSVTTPVSPGAPPTAEEAGLREELDARQGEEPPPPDAPVPVPTPTKPTSPAGAGVASVADMKERGSRVGADHYGRVGGKDLFRFTDPTAEPGKPNQITFTVPKGADPATIAVARKLAFVRARVAEGIPDENIQVGVNGYGPEFPGQGHVQVDEVRHPRAGNVFSANPEVMIQAGLDMPASKELLKLPNGNYTLPQVKAKLAELKAKEPPAPPAPSTAPVATWKGLTLDQVKRKLPVGFDESTARIENGRVIAKSKTDGKDWFVDVKKGEAEPVSPAAPTPSPAAPKPVAPASSVGLSAPVDVTQPPKAKKPYNMAPLRAPADEFKQLVLEHGVEHGWISAADMDKIVPELRGLKRGHSSASMAATVAMNKVLKPAYLKALSDLGIKTDNNTLKLHAEALPKLKALLEKHASMVSVPLAQMPDGSKFTKLGEEHTVSNTNTKTGIVTIKDGITLKVHMDDSVKIDPGSLKTPEAPAPTPKLRPGEKGTADLLQGPEAPFNLAGEVQGDPARIAAEAKAKADSAAAAKALAAKQQPDMFGQPPSPTIPPTMLGPGASGAAGEINPTGPRGNPVPTYGPSARMLEARRQRGVIAPVEPGQGIGVEEAINRGRALLDQGANPEAIMVNLERTKRFNADDAAVLRAHGERLEQAAYAAADKYGPLSDQYEKAWEADSTWSRRFKALATEWHKVGQGLQGETEIDTGTFHGLRKAFFDATGKDFNPKQAADATQIAKGVQDITESTDKSKADVFTKLDQEAAKAPDKPAPAPKPGQPAKPDFRTVWKRAKAMIEAGETDFGNIRQKLAAEFGMSMNEVSRVLAEPKGAKRMTDDLYRKMAEQRRLRNQAKTWVKDQQTPGWLRFTRAIPRVFFIDKVIGHGTVGMITHAGLNIFNPPAWRTYWPAFFQQYKLLGWHDQGAYHERMMQDLVRDPNYIPARRAGLANDPQRYFDDYQNNALLKYMGKIGLTGNRGFDALKLFRQARFNQLWDKLPENLQNTEYAKMLADSVNHSTGVVGMRFREWSNWTFFAPKLEGSRWAWMVGDPLKASKTFIDWRNSSPEARAFAMSQLREKAIVSGTYFTLLAMNQGLLSATGSDQKINFTNPRKSDFLSFKVAGHNFGVIGPMLGMVRLFANLVHASTGTRGQVESLSTRSAEFGEEGASYLRGKLSPFAGFGMDVLSQSDFQGRPLPFSNDKTPAYLRRQGVGPVHLWRIRLYPVHAYPSVGSDSGSVARSGNERRPNQRVPQGACHGCSHGGHGRAPEHRHAISKSTNLRTATVP